MSRKSRKLQPGSRASRALAVLAEHPDGLPTPQIAELLGEYPWGLNEICRVLRIRERNGQVTATWRPRGVAVHWKLARTSDTPATAEQPDPGTGTA